MTSSVAMNGKAVNASEVKQLAFGRWPEILEHVAGIDSALLDGRHHPCPKCGGTDRFRMIDAEAGAVFCNQCFKQDSGDGLAAVKWMLDIDFPTACRRVADYLGYSGQARTNGNYDIVAEIARRKNVPLESWKKFGAVEAKRGSLEVCRVPMFDEHGKQCSWTDFATSGENWLKGMAAKGKPVGLFLPNGTLPNPGETVHIVEGPKDAAALHGLGLASVGLPTSSMAEKFARVFRSVPAVVIPDRDQAGEAGAQQTAARLAGVAASVRVARLPGELKPLSGDDVRDVLNKRDGENLLRQAIADAVEWKPGKQSGEPKSRPIVRCFKDIASKPIEWLWTDRIALGRLTIEVGRPGIGKSYKTCDMAARISTGTAWPDGTPCPQGSVLFITAEDDPSDTIRPRLDAHGADVSRIHILSMIVSTDDNGEGREVAFQLRNLAELEEAIQSIPDCRLVVIDPLGSFLGSGTDAHRDNEVRAVLAPVAQLAEKYRVAVFGIVHNRKATAAHADDTAMGSRAFTGLARSVWHLSEDPENKNRRLWLPGKNNLSARQSGLAFSIEGDPGRVVWEREPVDMHADDAVAAETRNSRPGPRSEALTEAVEFLQSVLADGPLPTKEVEQDAMEGHGISKSTLKRARKEIGVETFHPDIPGPWWLRLPEPVKHSGEKELGHLGPLGENTGKTANSDKGTNQKELGHLDHLGPLGTDQDELGPLGTEQEELGHLEPLGKNTGENNNSISEQSQGDQDVFVRAPCDFPTDDPDDEWGEV